VNKYLLKHRIYLIFLIFITLSSFQFFILFVNASDPTVEKWPIQGDYTPPYGGTLKTGIMWILSDFSLP
jgi:hypothetical protein